MSSITLGETSVQFPVLNPGQGAQPQSIALTLNGAATPVSLAITDAPEGVFSAELIITTLTRVGLTSTVLANTDDGDPIATVSPTQPGIQSSYSISIYFTAPTSVPARSQGTLVVSWPDGSANVTLVGTTAQLTASVVRPQPIPLKPGATASVPVNIYYASGDAATLNVQLGPGTFPAPPPAGLTVSPAAVELPPVFDTILRLPGSGPSPSGRLLLPFRAATVMLTVSADIGIEPGTQVCYVSVTTPDFPQLNPAPVKVTFDVQPLPVVVSLKQQQPVSVIAGESVSVTLLAAEPGASTLLKLGTPSTPSGVHVDLSAPAWQDRETGIGGGPSTASAPLVISVDSSASPFGPAAQAETISIPWTAYGGRLSGTLQINISVLPNLIAFTSGSLTALSATASVVWTLAANGYWRYSGSIKNSEVLASNYSLGMKLNVIIDGKPLPIVHTGTVGPDLPFFNNTDSWEDQGIDDRIRLHWREILAAHSSAVLSVSTNAFDAVLEGLGLTVAVYYGAALVAAVAVGAVAAAVVGGAWAYKNCTFTYGPYRDDNGGVGFGVTGTCPKGPGD